MNPSRVAASADVAPSAVVGDGSMIWDHAQLREDSRVGAQCTIGRAAYIGVGVQIGDRVKIQNQALIYEPAIIEDGAFVGPGAILTNDRRPRAVNRDGSLKSAADWDQVGVHVMKGASIGAGAVCVAPVRVGAWAMVAANSTVTRDVPDFALVAGSPGRRVGWVGRDGARLHEVSGTEWACPTTGERYVESEFGLTLVEDVVSE